ncbi:MAG: hypothetical protein KatS3mg050_0696 [Litorilinea sp.]|nr:MAG: hypothetical protein KatS3mg050_0696 [Litorilinea sp.]
MLNAANPSTLKPDEIAERDELNTKFGDPTPVSPGSPKESKDLGEFNEKAVRQAIENDRNRKDWTQDQKDAYVNARRAEHDKKAVYDESLKQKENEQELTTEQQKQKLDQELAQVQEDLGEGKITAQDALQKLVNNRHARDILLRSVLEKHQKGKELTPYEKVVAEKTLQMQKLMREVQMAPKVMKAMEKTIKGLKDEYKKAAQFRINEQNAADPKTQENVALRAKLSNQIAAQAAHIAKYAGITSVNVNEFKSVNSDLMKLIGVRSSFNNILVQIGTGIVRKANTYRKDIDARRIVHRA